MSHDFTGKDRLATLGIVDSKAPLLSDAQLPTYADRTAGEHFTHACELLAKEYAQLERLSPTEVLRPYATPARSVASVSFTLKS